MHEYTLPMQRKFPWPLTSRGKIVAFLAVNRGNVVSRPA